MTARMIRADEALALGLVDKVVPPEALMDEAMKLANAIAANAPFAVREAKKLIRRFTGSGLPEDLDLEAASFGGCFATEDQKMAMEAFVTKTEKAPFTGK